MKKISRLTGIALAVAMIIALASISAAAFTYEPINGTEIAFKSTISKAEGTPTPAWTVNYAVTAGQAVTENGYESVHAGPNPGAVTLTNGGVVTFTAGGADSQTVTINFSAVSFSEPGVYRYVLKQTGAAALGMTLDESLERNLDVYVYDNEGALAIQGYTLAGKRMGATGDGKDDGFTNMYTTHDLTVIKTVSGLQASRDKYFKFTIEISGLTAGSTYAIVPTSATSGNNAATKSEYRNQTNPTSVTGAESGPTVVTVYLQNGDSVTVKNLPKGATYTITEDKENYTNNPPENASGTINENVEVTFLNVRNETIPTGVLLTVIPGVLLLGAGIAGIVIMTKKKKSSDDDTEDED